MPSLHDTSPLVRALQRINALRERSLRIDEGTDELFEQWERTWSDVRRRVTDRLRRIDAKLGQPEIPAIVGVVGVPPDGHELSPMAG